MNIKPFVVAAIVGITSVTAYAQKAELNKAKSSFEKYEGLKSMSPKISKPILNEAKASIDKAALDSKTGAMAETWAYRALIYSSIAAADTTGKTSAAPTQEATAALKKAVELDTKGEQKANIAKVNTTLAQLALNQGVREYKAQKYADAYTAFNSGLTYMPNDTTFTYYAGLSAMAAKDYPKAIDKLSGLLKTNYSNLEDVYNNLSLLYAAQKDTAKAIEVSAEGAKRFPKNTALAQREIELSLMTGKQDEVISRIEEQAAKEPKNKLYPYYLGIAYSNAKNKDLAKAEENYKKAIEIDPSYTDAYINLGGLIMNNGIDRYNKANKIKDQKVYEAEMKKANADFDRAFPYVQKAAELDPKNKLALSNLKTYYLIKKNQAKVAEIQKQLDSLQ
ncbi:tetratricopeptide repeat protein [Pedobacter sp. BS3]|uniref:tetratricopeptide repeat protein n=1 Tax=Pedobacter sp. BS3 TaxID=2567937 RepID=UPI0011EF60B2|nr:tetratricopeptide repeat protein [Pedobacter sp. BS3]TZF84673.1 tetratricopeptide repeat protein [Pedobacter sp. BS3]